MRKSVSPRIFTVFARAALPLIVAFALNGDTLELKTGERIEGAFKQATLAGAMVEVGGQIITFPLDKVKAIYFGSAPGPSQTAVVAPLQTPSQAPLGAALDALKALHSIVESGPDYRDYSQRVSDTKVKVDQYLAASTGATAERKGVETAMREYELARDVWFVSPNFLKIAQLNASRIQMIGEFVEDPDATCAILTSYSRQQGQGKHGEDLGRAFLDYTAAIYEVRHVRMHEALWNCAAGHIIQAQKSIGQQ